jgi:hypothetical protein
MTTKTKGTNTSSVSPANLKRFFHHTAKLVLMSDPAEMSCRVTGAKGGGARDVGEAAGDAGNVIAGSRAGPPEHTPIAHPRHEASAGAERSGRVRPDAGVQRLRRGQA